MSYAMLHAQEVARAVTSIVLDHDTADGPLYAYGYPPGKYVVTAYHPSGNPEPAVLELTSY